MKFSNRGWLEKYQNSELLTDYDLSLETKKRIF